MMTPMQNLYPIALLCAGAALLIVVLRPEIERIVMRRRLRLRMKTGARLTKQKKSSAHLIKFHPLSKRIILYIIAGCVLGVSLACLKPFLDWPIALRLGLIIASAYLGFRIPFMQDERAALERRRKIEQDLPATIDLLIVMLDAGATFDDAILRLVGDHRFPDRPIKQELKRLANELTVSPQRHIAFEKFSSSVALNDMRLFCSVLMQSEIYGTPVSRGLRGLAHEIRERQFHAVEAQAGALGPKLTIPMTLFFLPLIFIVVLAPTIIRAFHLP